MLTPLLTLLVGLLILLLIGYIAILIIDTVFPAATDAKINKVAKLIVGVIVLIVLIEALMGNIPLLRLS